MIRKWWLKCAAQRFFSHIPGGRRINDLWNFRRNKTWFDEFALEQGLIALNMLRDEGFDLNGKTALEFGSGRRPILPLLFRIAGCQKIILCDLFRIMNRESLLNTIQNMKERSPQISAQLGIDPKRLEEIFFNDNDLSLMDLLQKNGLEYRAPFDVRQTGFSDKSLDMIFSRTVLEHIPEGDLSLIMNEMRRILKPGGVMVHIIDTSDHWQHFDRGLSRINFLKFSPGWWNIINSPLAYQNRLRSREHVQIIKDAGFKISSIKTELHGKFLEDMKTMKIHPDFSGRFSPEELAVISTYLIALPA
jgi:SAM-dependent methyltransferase